MAIINDIEKVLTEFGINLNNDTRKSLKDRLNERRRGYSIKNSRKIGRAHV